MDERVRFINRLVAPLRVEPGRVVDLPRDFDPGYRDESVTREDAGNFGELGIEMLAEYQDRLWAQASAGVLLVLQGLDAAGKDGTIKHVMRGMNPQGVDVHSFSRPSTKELRHDFLWRCQQVLPERGRIGVFNRSHYEEVLIVRVHPEYLDAQRLPARPDDGSIWHQRYRAINDWEHYLVENGIRVVKIFLNLSKREQARRLLRRIDNPRKHWKFDAADMNERRHWDDYQEAYGAMLTHTSTEWAPWHVVPADRKWFARLATAAVLTQVLVELNPRYPEVEQSDREHMAEARAELVTELGDHKQETRLSTRSEA